MLTFSLKINLRIPSIDFSNPVATWNRIFIEALASLYHTIILLRDFISMISIKSLAIKKLKAPWNLKVCSFHDSFAY